MNATRPLSAALLILAPTAATAASVEFDFAGLGGPGLTAANEVGANTPVSLPNLASTAFGGEFGEGLVLDTESNTLNFSFAFSQLSGGLFDAATGIHLHESAPGADPFTSTGPIVFNLNSFDPDDAVTNTNTIINAASGDGSGAVSGAVTGSLVLSDLQEQSLLDGRFYLNIHSDTFRGGELRGNLVSAPSAVPTPAAAGLGLMLMGMVSGRRRRRA